MLPLFDPTLQPSDISNEKDATLIPAFKEPKIYSGLLPGNARCCISAIAFKYRTIHLHSFSGGFHYLHVGKPNLNIRLDSLMAQPDYVSSGFPSL